jgi:DNA modification methylase
MNLIEFGDCREIMRRWKEQGIKAQTCITSPPYYGLRDYGTAKYEGGDSNCDHTISGYSDNLKPDCDRPDRDGSKRKNCIKCGATRIDNQIGLEETPNEYIAAMVEVFRCVWDVLEDNGTLWVNIGDSYNGYKANTGGSDYAGFRNQPEHRQRGHGLEVKLLKNKDLIGIPWMLAFALRADGWYLRQDIIWHNQTLCLSQYKIVALRLMSTYFC